jgi:signal transduction histidine kinase
MKPREGDRTKTAKRTGATEKELTRVNRILQTLYQCNHALVRATDEHELLQSVCQILVEVGGIRMAWVGVCEDDPQKMVRPVAMAGQGRDYVESAKISWSDETDRGRGPTGIAIRTGQPYWAKDFRADPTLLPWRDAAVARGYASCVALPLIMHGTKLGVMNLYAGKPNAFNERSIQQYTDLANNLAYGVTALRTEEAMREAQSALIHVSRVTALGELAASITHELNQPLTGVISNSHACLRWIETAPPNLEEVRHGVERTLRDGTRAAEVITKIRSLLRKTTTEMAPVNINDAIQEVVALAQPEVRKNEVNLRVDLDLALPPVTGDRVLLQQVILNLLINGIEALAPVGREYRKLQIRSQRSDPGTVLIAVSDTGIGFGQKSFEDLSKAFFTTKPNGMGMGLSISRSIVTNHGGHLCAEPNPDRGATFQFTLPLDPQEAARA